MPSIHPYRVWSIALTAVLATVAYSARSAKGEGNMDSPFIMKAESRAVPVDAAACPDGQLRIDRQWQGPTCRSRLLNTGTTAVRVREIVLFAGQHRWPATTRLYGEGFTMLSQTGGTLGKPEDIGYLTDRKHYRIPEAADAVTVYELAILQPAGGDDLLMAFTSCRRFAGLFRFYPSRYEIVLDAEGLQIGPGQAWDLEEFTIDQGPDRNALLAGLAERINANHPPRRFTPVPTGWCSWYCFGAGVTAAQVVTNTKVIASRTPGLKYLQIDDGFQRAMGDWLEPRPDFGMGLKELCAQVRAAGLEPAIWVAPFVAEEKSQVFQEHPDWFVQDANGKPLRSDRVSFGGWRCGPWYCLDGTHPQVQKHLEALFRTMREQWGVTYFKLDGIFWGAMHGGKHFDAHATRVEAYRRGMEAILRGAGRGFILGCNHPVWPSLGLIDGARSSMDIGKSWDSIRRTAREAFCRNWQNGTLWLNDADVLRLGDYHAEQDLPARASIVYASGGLLLAGDDMDKLAPDRLAMLAKVTPPTGIAARFEDDTFRIGRMDLADRQVVFAFNWEDAAQPAVIRLTRASRVHDFWTGADLGQLDGELRLDLPAHGARVLVLTTP